MSPSFVVAYKYHVTTLTLMYGHIVQLFYDFDHDISFFTNLLPQDAHIAAKILDVDCLAEP